MAARDTAAPAPLGKVRAHILRMAGLSTTAIKVLRTCNEPNACANDLNRVISLDPVLTGRVLQLINSAYYSLPSKVNSLTRAIILLGINTVKNLVLSFAVFQSFSHRDSFRAFTADQFWTHSLCTAAAAKLLAGGREVPLAEREEYFVAGLMHDIGKIPLNHLFPEAYRAAVAGSQESGRGMRCEENLQIGVDHCRVGHMIARKWQLSPALTAALTDHHTASEVSTDGFSLVEAVALADALAHHMGAGTPGGHSSLDADGRGCLQMRWDAAGHHLTELSAAVVEEIEKAKVFLEIAGRN
jgi:putative nucleotidyltransferase with HDIG domain